MPRGRPGSPAPAGTAAASGEPVDLNARRRRVAAEQLPRLTRSSRYSCQSDSDAGLEPGLYAWSPEGEPYPILTGLLQVIEADASDVDSVASRLVVQVTHPETGAVYTLDVTRDRAARGQAWEPLTASGLLFPAEDRAGRRAYAALSDLAANQARRGLVVRRRVAHLGWHDGPAGPVWVAADGTVTPAGVERPGRLHAGPVTDPPQVLPALDADAAGRALRRVGEAVETLWGFFDGACPGIEAGILGAMARVNCRPLPGERRPGSLDFEGEIVGRSGWHKTAFLNAGLRLFAGAGYDYDSETQLTGGGKLKDTAIGQSIMRSELAYHPYADFDHAAHRGSPEWEPQQRHRVESLHLTGNASRGGTVGTKDGGTRERRQPAGWLVRTFEEDPHLFSVPLGESGADFRAMTFKLPGRSADGRRERRQRSMRLFGPLAPTLDALRLAWLRWQAGMDAERWAALAAGLPAEVDRLLVPLWDQAPAADELHDRPRRQLAEVLTGLTLYAFFLDELGHEDAAGLVLDCRAPLVEARVQATAELTEAHADASGMEAPDEHRAALDALHAALFSGRAHLVAIDTTGGRNESGAAPAERVGWGWDEGESQGDRIGWLNERTDELWLQRGAALGVIRRQYRATSGAEFPLSDRALWSGLAKRGLLVAHDLNTARRTVPVRRWIDGREQDVLILSAAVLTGADVPAAPPVRAAHPPEPPAAPPAPTQPSLENAPTVPPAAPPEPPEPPVPARPRATAPKPSRAGVLDAAGLHLPDGRHLEGFRPATVAMLAGVALEFGLRQVWLHASAIEALGLEVPETQGKPVASEWITAGLDAYNAVPAGLAPWITIAERDATAPRKLGLAMVTANESLEAFAGLPDGPSLLRALEAFRARFGIGFYSSPGRTGLILLNATIGRGLRPGRSELAPPSQDREVREAPFIWSRPLTDAEREHRYVHGFDVNGQYLAAMSSLRLSAGQPAHIKAPEFDAAVPGYWLVKLPPPPGGLLPDPFRPVVASRRRPEPADGFVWLTTPSVAFMAELGHAPEIREAWIWRTSRRFLEGFYARCRDARTALQHATTPEERAAYQAVKLVYTKTLGRFESAQFNEPGGEFYRPEWHHHVIAKARTNLARKLVRLTRPPFAVDVDALYFTAAEADPVAAAREVGVPLSEQLGAFKPAGSAPASVIDVIELGVSRAALKVRGAVEQEGQGQ